MLHTTLRNLCSKPKIIGFTKYHKICNIYLYQTSKQNTIGNSMEIRAFGFFKLWVRSCLQITLIECLIYLYLCSSLRLSSRCSFLSLPFFGQVWSNVWKVCFIGFLFEGVFLTVINGHKSLSVRNPLQQYQRRKIINIINILNITILQESFATISTRKGHWNELINKQTSEKIIDWWIKFKNLLQQYQPGKSTEINKKMKENYW